MRTSVFLLLMIRLVGPMVLCQGADALTISWGDLQNVVAGRIMTVDTRGSHQLQGLLVNRDDAGMQMAITATKPKGLHPKNAVVRVERDQLQRIRVRKDPSKVSGRIAGPFIGFFAGGYVGTVAGGGEQNLGGVIGFFAGPIVGYYWGRWIDHEAIDITILDASTSTPSAPVAPNSARLPHYLLPQPPEASPGR